MKPGRKPASDAQKIARGTARRDRRAGMGEIVSPSDLPQQPDWLTPAGQAQWLDNIGRVSGMAGEADSVIFATFCNLAGACASAWSAGDVPPAAALAELRRLGEMFGLTGAGSRPAARRPSHDNAFLRRRAD